MLPFVLGLVLKTNTNTQIPLLFPVENKLGDSLFSLEEPTGGLGMLNTRQSSSGWDPAQAGSLIMQQPTASWTASWGCPPYLGVGRSSVLGVQVQGFVPAALTDQLCCIQSHVLVQDLIALQKTHGKQQHEAQELGGDGFSHVCTTPHT